MAGCTGQVGRASAGRASRTSTWRESGIMSGALEAQAFLWAIYQAGCIAQVGGSTSSLSHQYDSTITLIFSFTPCSELLGDDQDVNAFDNKGRIQPWADVEWG